MEVFSLGNKPWQPCYVVRLEGITVMLDAALDLSTLLNFLPLPLVYSPKLSSLSCWKPRGQVEEETDVLDEEIIKLFRENVGHIFIDSSPLFRLPETGLVDFSTIDVLLVTNCFSILSLPYLTEKLNFRGKVYATEPTLHFGRQLMEELANYIHRNPNRNSSDQWKNAEAWSTLPDGNLKEAADFQSWKELYTAVDIQKAVAHVRPVSYSQKLDLYGLLTATAVSSGFCLGSCNWLLETDHYKVTFVSSSSTFTTHPCPMERVRLMSSDIMILCGLTNAPSANPDAMLGELCGILSLTLRSGGNVLIPCYPTGVVYDLLECLKGFLDNAGLSSIPIYFISPAAHSSLSHSNIYAEWLCDSKKSKVLLPEVPFPHLEFISSGRLKHFPNVHGELGAVYQSPCVVFTGHPSLRCGDAVHFMEAWGDSPKNAIIFTEPDFDHLHALAPYQPLSMKAFYFPIDPRLNFFVANKLLKELAPRCLVTSSTYLPSSAHAQSESLCLQPEMPFHGIRRGRIVKIPLKGQYERIQISPELAGNLHPQEVYPGVSMTSLSGMLSTRNNKHMLQPNVVSQGRQHWGRPSADAIVQALREHGVVEVNVEEEAADMKVIKVLNGKAVVKLTSTSTTIHNCHDEKLRNILKSVISRQLVQI